MLVTLAAGTAAAQAPQDRGLPVGVADDVPDARNPLNSTAAERRVAEVASLLGADGETLPAEAGPSPLEVLPRTPEDPRGLALALETLRREHPDQWGRYEADAWPADRRPELPEELPSARDLVAPAPASLPAASAAGALPAEDDGRERHPPIVVEGDRGATGFVLVETPLTGEHVPRPGSGVRGGTGTPDDPYVISSWNVSGIVIRDTDAHVRIVDNRVSTPQEGPYPVHGILAYAVPGPGGETPITLEDADNVTVVDNEIVRDGPDAQAAGVSGQGADNLTVKGNERFGNLSAGVAVADAEGVTVRDELFGLAVEDVGVAASGTTDLRVDHASFQDLEVGVSTSGGGEIVVANTTAQDVYALALHQDASSVRVVDNAATGAYLGAFVEGGNATLNRNDVSGTYGLVADEAGDVQAADNDLDADFVGLYVTDSESLQARENRVPDAAAGIFFDDLDGLDLRRNRIGASGYGIVGGGVDEGAVVDNEIAGPFFGLLTVGTENLTARANTVEGAVLGAYLILSPGSTVSENVLRDPIWGITLSISDGATLARNTVRDASLGAGIFRSQDTRLFGNALDPGGLLLSGGDRENFRHEIPANNTADGEPIRYVWNATNAHIPGAGAQLVVAGSSQVTVHAGTYEDVYAGVTVGASDNVTVQDGAADNSTYGHLLLSSENITLEEPATNDTTLGITILGTEDVDVRAPDLRNGSYVGVLAAADDLAVHDGQIDGSTFGFFSFGTDGVTLEGTEVTNATLAATSFVDEAPRIAGTDLDGSLADAYLAYSSDAVLHENRLADGGLLAVPLGDDPGYEIPPNNTVHGEPVRYIEGANGGTVPAPAGQAILVGSGNVTASGLDLADTSYTVQIWDSTNITLEDGTVPGRIGLVADDARDLHVSGADVEASEAGLIVFDSPGFALTDSTVRRVPADADAPGVAFPVGVGISGSPGVNVTGNSLEGMGLFLLPGAVPRNTVADNTVNGDPLVYHENAQGVTVAPPAGQVVLVDVLSAAVRDVDLPASTAGVLAHGVDDLTVTGVNVSDTGYGMFLDEGGLVDVRDTRLVNDTVGLFTYRTDPVDASNLLVDGRGSPGVGLYQIGGDDFALEDTTFEGDVVGIVEFGDGIATTDSVVARHDYGVISVFSSDGVDGQGNHFTDNRELGVASIFSGTSDLRESWWSCPGGPDADACDDVLGDVRYDPWLASPNPDAGYDG